MSRMRRCSTLEATSTAEAMSVHLACTSAPAPAAAPGPSATLPFVDSPGELPQTRTVLALKQQQHAAGGEEESEGCLPASLLTA